MIHELTFRQIEAFINEQVDQKLFSGAILIAAHDSILFERAYGLANQRYGVPNNRETKFNMGSMNKMFTGVAVLQLVQAGRVALQARVGDYLPAYPNREVAEKVTLHHLLTHTSGLGHYWNDTYQRTSKDAFQTVDDFIALFVNDPLQFEPGQQFSYSNAGFYVLGAVIEAVVKRSYFDYVREHIYDVAGMTDSDCYEADDPVPNLAIGYTYQSDLDGENQTQKLRKLRSNIFLHVYKGGPAGGGYSTVRDLRRFAAALRSHQLLDPAHTELLSAGKVDTPNPNMRYAYGFADSRINGQRIVGHNGGFPGVAANLDIFPDSDVVSVVLANDDGEGAQRIFKFIREQVR